MQSITNHDDIIDSRDVIARIEHLSALREPGPVDLGEDNDQSQDDLFAELSALEKLAEQGEDCVDWQYGETLIRDSYFKRYAQELAEDCDMIPSGLGWPFTCIDWDRATRELQADYTPIEFDGVTYWVRS